MVFLSNERRTIRYVWKKYVGETKDPLNIRMNGRRHDWRHKRFERSPAGEHLCLSGPDFISHSSVCGFDNTSEWTEKSGESCKSY